MSGDFRELLIAVLSCATMASGVPAGATSPFQVTTRKSGNPSLHHRRHVCCNMRCRLMSVLGQKRKTSKRAQHFRSIRAGASKNLGFRLWRLGHWRRIRNGFRTSWFRCLLFCDDLHQHIAPTPSTPCRFLLPHPARMVLWPSDIANTLRRAEPITASEALHRSLTASHLVRSSLLGPPPLRSCSTPFQSALALPGRATRRWGRDGALRPVQQMPSKRPFILPGRNW